MPRMCVAAHLKNPTICRATADLDSEIVGMLQPGTTVEISEEVTLPTHKLRYRVTHPIEGWASAICFTRIPDAPKLRVLCLHSFRTNASILSQQLSMTSISELLKDSVELVYLDAPYVCTPSDEEKISEVLKSVFPTSRHGAYREWWNAIEGSEATAVYQRLEDTVEHVRRFARENAPIDGLLGFSQGATLALSLLAMTEAGKLPELGSVSFAMLFSPRMPRDPTLLQYFVRPLRTRTLVAFYEQDTVVSAELSRQVAEHIERTAVTVVSRADSSHAPIRVLPSKADAQTIAIRRFVEKHVSLEKIEDLHTGLSTGPVLVRYEGAVMTIVLNQPENNNTLSAEIADRLAQIAEMLHARRGEIRLVFLRSSGRTFCAGGDPKAFQASQKLVEQSQNMTEEERAAFDQMYKSKTLAFAKWMARLNTIPQVLVGLVQGNVFGGGNGLCACCDIVCAVKNVRFQLSEVRLGVIPAVISPFVISAMGPRKARRYFLTGEPMSAEVATDAGLCSQVVENAAGLEAFASNIRKTVMLAAPQAVAEAKDLVATMTNKDPSDPNVQEMTSQRLGRIQVSEEAKAGMVALLSRKPPPWAEMA